MSGEKSKAIGEYGEDIGRYILKLIGWNYTKTNFEIECRNPNHLNPKKNQRKTHGEDEYYIYECPIIDDRKVIAHISVKHTTEYGQPSTIRQKLKDDIVELSEIIECSKYSQDTKRIVKSYNSNRPKSAHIGLLIYTSHELEQLNMNVREELLKIRWNQAICEPVILIDNQRASFLFYTHKYLKNYYPQYSYTNPDFGFNLAPDSDTHQKFLNINMIASEILPFRIKVNNNFEAMLFSNDPFSEESLRKSITYSFETSRGFATRIHLGFSDYNHYIHKDILERVKMSLSNQSIEKFNEIEITTFCFKENFLNLENN